MSLTALDEIVSTDYQDHAPGRKPVRGALKAAAQTLRVAFPDMTSTVTHMLSEGDLIAVRNRVTGTQHTPLRRAPGDGNRVDFNALQLFRVEAGLLFDIWSVRPRARAPAHTPITWPSSRHSSPKVPEATIIADTPRTAAPISALRQ
jgi:predicted ester cyclase